MAPQLPTRVLVVDDDVMVLTAVGDVLHDAGYTVQLCQSATLAVPVARDFKPSVVILDLSMPILDGRELAEGLKKFPWTSDVLLIYLTGRASLNDVVKLVKSGADDVWLKPLEPSHLQRLEKKISARWRRAQPAEGPALWRDRLLAYFAADGTTGAIFVHQGTPFEGSLRLDRGVLQEARFGDFEGVAAVEELLSSQAGDWNIEQRDSVAHVAPIPRRTAGPAASRALLVDDEAWFRHVWGEALRTSGYQVESASNGAAGLERAGASLYDVIITDLNMPELDGWGMLADLRSLPTHADTPVVVSSSKREALDLLSMAGFPLTGWVEKGQDADEVVNQVRRLTQPREHCWERLRCGDGRTYALSRVGLPWFLNSCVELDLPIDINVRVGRREAVVKLFPGGMTQVRVVSDGRTIEGPLALALILATPGEATATFTHRSSHIPPIGGQPIGELLANAMRQVAASEEAVISTFVEGERPIEADRDLYRLLQLVGDRTTVHIAQALLDDGIRPRDLAATLKVSEVIVRRTISQLMRRRVLRIASEKAIIEAANNETIRMPRSQAD